MKIRIRPEVAALAPFLLAGLFFIVTGLAAVAFPRLFAIALAGAFVLLGVALCLAGFWFYRLRQHFTDVARQFNATIYVTKQNVLEDEEPKQDPKSVIYH